MEDFSLTSSAEHWPVAYSAPEEQFPYIYMLQPTYSGDGFSTAEFPLSWNTQWACNPYVIGVTESHPMPALGPTPLPPSPSSNLEHHFLPQDVRPEAYAPGSVHLHEGFSRVEHMQSSLDASDRIVGAGDGDTSTDVWSPTINEVGQEYIASEFCLVTSYRDSFASLPHHVDEKIPTNLHGVTSLPSTSESYGDHFYHGHCTSSHDRPPSTPPDPPALSLDAEDPQWKLSLDTYGWIFAVMYPKRRPNKKEPTPSGPCRLCPSISRRPGILQQHLTVLHRQRIARKVLAGHQYNAVLALAFVVAQLESHPDAEHEADATCCERVRFKDLIARHPLGPDRLNLDEFPLLSQKLSEFSARDSWMGVRCKHCGMLATRSVALAEHANVCAGAKRVSQSNGTVVDRPTVKLTSSGRAARPSRATH